jgi:hypothetical protein
VGFLFSCAWTGIIAGPTGHFIKSFFTVPDVEGTFLSATFSETQGICRANRDTGSASGTETFVPDFIF